ncbi:MAG: hypothetical protein COT85_03495 [Chlamydiae bacterium CG10_big_fil_rev_8_21_14_0_10_42_34]|nr:MAG: hypothetical protein COT85_03495 [Chlamydiae bacterium CG10_big_fil_rev_8_21_14_0_10_42_34]
MSICRGRIDALQDAIEQWRKYATRHDALTVEEEKAVEKKLFAVIKMFEREQFLDVQKQSSVEIASLQSDMNRIRDEAIAKAEQDRTMRRRLQYSAETLISIFKSIQRQIPEAILDIASSSLTATETELAAMNATLSRILAEYTMSSTDKKSMTPLQKELSKKLAEGEKLQTLSDWKVHHEDANSLEKDHRLDRLIAELEATEDKSSVKSFLDRITSISLESSPNRRSLLTDSLILDLVAHSNERKTNDKAITSMREIRSELHRFKSKQAKDLEALLTRAIDAKDPSSSKLLHDKGIALIKEETKAMAGESRRTAILKGLSELGYEVRENMATAWAENGRIVVRKPNEKGYGVELGAVEDAERVQVQLVSFKASSHASKASQDRDRETIWCSEFSRLQSLLEKSGTSLHIEKALPVGAKPLKQVQESSTTSDRSRRSKESNLKKMHD